MTAAGGSVDVFSPAELEFLDATFHPGAFRPSGVRPG
jgi:hypothetical protein